MGSITKLMKDSTSARCVRKALLKEEAVKLGLEHEKEVATCGPGRGVLQAEQQMERPRSSACLEGQTMVRKVESRQDHPAPLKQVKELHFFLWYWEARGFYIRILI